MQIKLHPQDTEDEWYRFTTVYSNATKQNYGNVCLDYSGLRMGTSWKGPPGSGDSVFLKPYGFEYWEKNRPLLVPRLKNGRERKRALPSPLPLSARLVSKAALG